MRNIIFLSANYEYTCLVAKQFAEQKNLDFMDINYYVETKLAKNLEKQSALSKYTEQLVLDALQKQNKVFAMDIVYLACKKIKDFLECSLDLMLQVSMMEKLHTLRMRFKISIDTFKLF